jgi:hypothetical protein
MIFAFPFVTASFDPDARAFVNTSAATDRAAINHFVKGIKRLGLWDDMVCWPLRSAQNAGTGSTAYSLGGLGVYDGTLVNGPTWGADGVNFNVVNAYIGVTGTINQPLTVMGAVDFKTTTNGGALIDGSDRVHLFNGGSNAEVQFFAGSFINAANTYSTGTNFIAGYANGASSSVHVNGSATTGNAGANNLGGNTIFIGNNNSQTFGDNNIDIAFCAIFNGQAYNDAVRSLYKSTLGQGLGLP